MHVTQNTINSSPRQPENIGSLGMCPFAYQRPQNRAETNNVHNKVFNIDFSSKQNKSQLSDYGMT